jgi:predicted enzyme related to lactoylglutathione lyase
MSCLGEECGHGGCGAADHAHQIPGGRRFTFFDPSGNRLVVWSTA